MKEEYNYTITVPLADTEEAIKLLDEVKQMHPQVRLTRKPDTKTTARFYLSFPYKGTRTDLKFYDWISDRLPAGWDLFGPNYGVWGLS